ncbi:autoinducer 2 ABC transporter substrate-binding protein [Bacillus sp. FJAT-50079]|uniref:autoinducer 2 ABC transporter substrate-binding protein n=1 Tax=Bacillus sp. FJAT-50079 TaxID=2833577 RepID=UPI001BCA1391|nr:autoinducer 2 ABC transporter substrate-binding protein [Bacillus sp. FJAT-50079]MBS4210486.1 autoinducer 2 ABC transporter substrate-binding protein [Bacillus sp. FJAT-50079]
MGKVIRIFGILLMLMSVALAGCSGDEKSSGNTSSDESKKSGDGATYKIATVVKVSGSEWFERMEQGIQNYSEETGDETFLLGPPELDAAQQRKIIEDLIAQQVDAIFVVPISPESLDPVLKRARDEGIVVVTHEAAGIKNADYDIEAFDNGEYGEHFMDQLATSMGEKGDYAIMVGSLTAKSHNEATDAAIALQKEKYPEMNLVAERVESNDDTTTAYERTKELLKAHPSIKGLIGFAMIDPAGMSLAIEEMGLTGKVQVFGTSLVSVSGKYIDSDIVNSISFWDPADIGNLGMKVVRKALEGEQINDGEDLGVEGYNNINLVDNVIEGQAWIDVNKENMSEYDF